MPHKILLARRSLDGRAAYHQLDDANTREALIRIHRGSYVQLDTNLDDKLTSEQRLAARAIAVGHRNVGAVSGVAAAALWHLPLEPRHHYAAVQLTRASYGKKSKGLEFIRTTLQDHELATVAGIRVTSITRTLQDLAIQLPPEEAYAAMNAARRHGHNLEPLRDVQGEARERIKWLLNNTHDRSDSMGESLLDYRLLLENVSPPLRQPNVFDEHGRWLGRPDMVWESGAIHEFDGTAKWLNDDGSAAKQRIRKAQQRAEQLTAAGWLLTTSQWRDVSGPSEVTTRIRQALEQVEHLPSPRGFIEIEPLPPVELKPWEELFEVPKRYHYEGLPPAA